MAEVAVAAVLQRVGCLVVQEATSLHEVPAKVETLVSEVRDVAYRVENIIDSANILARENSRARSFMGAISKGAHYPFHCMNLNEIPRYSMEENEHLCAKRLILPDFDDKVDVIGFDSEINQIKDELLDSENKDLTVLSLVGPGGAGKSTIARKVYNLIVLDDVWRIKAWDMIEAAFPNVRECSLEETALRYVEELAQRCMILIEDRSSGWIKTIKIHDVLREWGLGRARREGFFKDCSCRNDVDTAYSNEMRAHRVVLHGSVGVKVGVAIPNLHTLLLFNAARLEKIDFSLRGLNYLRVLYFNGMRREWELPKEIGKMIHLRYLGLKGGTYILPVSMGGLTNLHTFDAREATVDKLPSALWSILTLRYVHVYKVESEWSLPKISVQSNLKYLFIFLGCNMQEQSEATMQSYDRMERHPSWCFGKYYRDVNQLEMVGSCEDEFGAPNSLHLPDLIFLPHNLEQLKFSCPNLLNDEDPMPTLGSWLQFLNVLEIGVRSYTGATMTCPSGGFPNLFNLALHDLDIEAWILEDGAMPKLRILTLCKCTKLKALPEGLQYLQELTKLKVIAMPELCQDVCNILHKAGCKVVIRPSEEDFQHIQIPKDDR